MNLFARSLTRGVRVSERREDVDVVEVHDQVIVDRRAFATGLEDMRDSEPKSLPGSTDSPPTTRMLRNPPPVPYVLAVQRRSRHTQRLASARAERSA